MKPRLDGLPDPDIGHDNEIYIRNMFITKFLQLLKSNLGLQIIRPRSILSHMNHNPTIEFWIEILVIYY